jgi:hypothetical protein
MTGCRARVIEAHKPVNYLGPIDPIEQVIGTIATNNQKIPTLRGEGSFEAWIREAPQGKTQFVNGDLTLLYQQPQFIRIIAKKPAAGTIFDIGGNDTEYWVTLPTQDTMRWGSYANIENVDPELVPIRPDLVLEVLGILPMQTNLLQPPAPVMRFNSDYDMYMIVWSQPTQTHWAAVKEIWYDRKTLLPQMVLLFDASGRVVLRARLYDHKPVEIEGVPESQWPLAATRYELLFPLNGSKFDFDLKQDLALKRNNAPNQRTFVRPNANNSGVSNNIPLDRTVTP